MPRTAVFQPEILRVRLHLRGRGKRRGHGHKGRGTGTDKDTSCLQRAFARASRSLSWGIDVRSKSSRQSTGLRRRCGHCRVEGCIRGSIRGEGSISDGRHVFRVDDVLAIGDDRSQVSRTSWPAPHISGRGARFGHRVRDVVPDERKRSGRSAGLVFLRRSRRSTTASTTSTAPLPPRAPCPSSR